jgi:glycosyltransferase involved in cell wall biosynthesis
MMLSDFYPPEGGGLELCVQTLSRELVARSHDVTAVVLAQSGRQSVEEDQGVTVRRVDGWSRALLPFYRDRTMRFLPPVPDPGVGAAIRALVAAERPDVVHAHSWIALSYLAASASRAPATVYTLHDYGLVCVTKSLFRNGAPCAGPELAKCIACASHFYGVTKGSALAVAHRASRALNARVDRYIAISEPVASASEQGARGVPMIAVPSFVPDDIVEIAALTPRPDFLPSGEFLLFVGNETSQKGLEVVIAAHRQMRARIPLVCIGVARAAEHRDDVVFIPRAPHDQVLCAFAACRAAVVPSQWTEPFGLVAVEAMTLGKPAVVAGHGGLATIVTDEVNGLHVPPGDVAGWTRALDRICTDDDLAAKLGRKARLDATRYHASTVVPKIEAIYRDAVASRCAAVEREALL